MSEFTGPASSWYDPPELHDIDLCGQCHDDGHHDDDVEGWADDGCGGCVDTLRKAVDNKEYCLRHHAWYCEEVHGEQIQIV
jgi:hypothetical protein